MKLLSTFCVLVAGAGAAKASFELALIYQSNTNNIVRYDPTYNLNLGSFGNNLLGTHVGAGPSLSIDARSPGQVAALNFDAKVRWIDYSSGTLVRSVQLDGVGSFDPDGQLFFRTLHSGNLLVTGVYGDTGKSTTRIFDGNTGAFVRTLPVVSGETYICNSEGINGTIFRLVRTGSITYEYKLEHYSSNGDFLSSHDFSSGLQIDSYTSIDSTENAILIVGGSSTPRVLRFSYSGETLSYVSSLGFPHSGGGAFGWAQFGHGNQSYFRQSTDALYYNYWYTMDPLGLSWGTRWEMPYSTSLGSMALVSAPETSSLTSYICLISIFLLRRPRGERKKSHPFS